MLPLPKTGDLSHGISLSSQVAKTINKMIINRIMSKIDIHLRHNQNGFRPGPSTRAHILAIRNDNLLADTGARNTNELAKMMNDRDDWKKRVFEVKRLKRRLK